MTDLTGSRIDGIKEAIAVVDVVKRTKFLDIVEGVLRINIESQKGSVWCDRRLVIGAAIGIRGQCMRPVGIVVASVVGCTRRGEAPDRIMQGLRCISNLCLSVERVIEAETFRSPAGLWNNQVVHQALEHAATPTGDEVDASIGVMALEDGELLTRLRITIRRVVALGCLSLPCKVGRQRSPRSPPDITRHLVRADANVGSNARLRVEQAVVETCRPLVGVIATVHLTSGNALVLVTIIVEDAEIHRIQECSSTYGQRWKHLSDEDQPRRIPGAINSGDKSTFSRLPLLIGSSRT